jgi:hypothetical protein
MQFIEWKTSGTTPLTFCIGRYAFKFARSGRGRDGNRRERLEWDRATPARREMLCPIVWTSPFALVNLMRRAIPLSRDEQLHRIATHDFPDWDYMPGGPGEPFEYKESDWGYLEGRLVALDRGE